MNFSTLEPEHLRVVVDGVLVHNYEVREGQVVFHEAPPEGQLIVIFRVSPQERIVDFTNTSMLNAEVLDTDSNQLLYMIQEALANAGEALRISWSDAGAYDARGLRITNLGDPKLPSDVVNKEYTDGVLTPAKEHADRAEAAKDEALDALEKAKDARDDAKRYADEAKASAENAEESANEVKRMDVFYNRPVNAKKKKKLLAWIDDDGRIDFYDYFKGLHNDYGVVFNAAIVGSWIGNSNRLSKEQIQELQSYGFGFPSHGYTHDSNKKLWDMTEEELHEEFRLALASLKEIGSDSQVLVYGFGAQNELVREVARQYFIAGIDTRTVKSGDNPGGYNAGLVSNFALQRLNIHMGNDICFPILEEAAANNEPIILMSHINQSGWPSDAEIRALIEKCLSLGYEFVTIDDYIRRTGNALEMGDMIVNANGETRTVGRYRYGGRHRNQMPADYFPDDVVTRFFVANADSSKFGLTGAGEIKTYKFADNNYTYQEYTSPLERKVLYRKWDTQGNEWGPWEDWGLGRYRYGGKHVNQMPADYFPDDVVTRFFVTNADSSNFGLPGAGEIKTYKFADNNYTYQEYTSALEGRVLYRKWDTQGNQWGPWGNWASDVSLYDNTTTVPFNVLRNKWNELPNAVFPRLYTLRAAQGYIGLGVVLKLSNGTGAAIVIQRDSITYNEYDGTNWTTHDIVGGQNTTTVEL